MKDTNFDIRGYLVENKMTENSRGDARKHFTGDVVLKEMKMPVEEGCHENMNERIDKDALYREYIGFETKYGRDKAVKIFQKFHPDVEIGSIIPRYARANQAKNDRAEQSRLTRLHSRDRYNEDPDWRGDAGYVPNVGNYEDMQDLKEAGYVEDDDDFDDPYEKDLDFTAGDSLASIIAGTNKKAKKAAEKDLGADAPKDDDDDKNFEAPEDLDADESGEEEEAPAEDAPAAEPGEDYVSQIKYNPETVEIMMDDEELNEYLGSFRRPAAAVRTLNRAIKATQDEVNESIGLKHLYIVLGRGFYHSSSIKDRYKDEDTHEWYPGKLTIAKVSADEEWRKKNFGDDEDEE